MPLLQRLSLIIASFALFAIAIALLLQSDLPERAAYTGQYSQDGELFAPERQAKAPLFSTTAWTGEAFQLADLRGKPVILNFWATWCEPCLVEMPQLQELYENQNVSNVEVVAVNLGESPAFIADWVAQMGLTFTIVLDPDGRIQASYQLRGQPSTYIISPDGTIIDLFYGPVSAGALESVLKNMEQS